MKKHITILGGGIGGLAAGYFSRQHGFPIAVYEAASRAGGNAATIRHGDFLFDTGAHRFHARNEPSTREVFSLLDGNLERIYVPSQIHSRGRRFDFPLKPMNLFAQLGPAASARAGLDFLAARWPAGRRNGDFESMAVSRYGRAIAARFLLGYSQKLWGIPPRRLAPEVAGLRLQGLNLRTVIKEVFLGGRAATAHLDGVFYYPRQGGIGAIAERLLDRCGREALRLDARVTRVFQRDGRIRAIAVNGRQRIEVDEVVSSLPVSEFLSRLEPPPPAAVQEAARRLRFRNVILAALFIDRPGITPYASIYFADPQVPFTRVYEPKNRSLSMAPADRTALVAEIPCQSGDPLWNAGDAELVEAVRAPLCREGFLEKKDVHDAVVVRLHDAYPILEADLAAARLQVLRYLSGFANLSLTGRGGQFRYIHIHDLLRRGREIADRLAGSAPLAELS